MEERKKYHRYFQQAERVNGEKFFKCIDETPEDLRELIKRIHFDYFDCLPNDWIYETIRDAFLTLEHDNLDDINIEADVYYHQLQIWLGNGFAHEYCNEVLEEWLDLNDIYQIIGAAQERAKERIFRAVDEFINEEGE